MLEIQRALVHDSKGEIVEFSADTINAVDEFVVANDYRRECARERSFMYRERSFMYSHTWLYLHASTKVTLQWYVLV